MSCSQVNAQDYLVWEDTETIQYYVDSDNTYIDISNNLHAYVKKLRDKNDIRSIEYVFFVSESDHWYTTDYFRSQKRISDSLIAKTIFLKACQITGYR